MSTEDDLATITAVTEKLTGPTKVWVSQRSGDHQDLSLHWTREGALKDAEHDLCSAYNPPLPAAEVQAHMAELRLQGYTQALGCYDYHVRQQVIEE